MNNEYKKRWAQQRKEKGLCCRCDKPIESGNVCSFHKEQRRETIRKRRLKLREDGRCVHCGVKTEKAYCKKCSNKNKGYINKSSSVYKLGQLKQSARIRNILFEIEKEEFVVWFESTEKRCYYCGVEKDVLKTTGRKKALITIDRKDNNIGYKIGNLCFACHRCNNLKSNFFTEQQWLEIANKYIVPNIVKYHCLEINE